MSLVRPRLGALLMVLPLLLAGCAGGTPAPEPAFYRVEPPDSLSAGLPWSPGVVVVRPFEADGLLRERAIAFLDPDTGTLKQHHYHYWSDAPPRMLQYLVVDYLRARGAGRLVSADGGDAGDLYVSGRLMHWERVVGDDAAQVKAALELTLRRADDDTPLLVEVYAADKPAEDLGMEASVAAFNAAVLDLLERFDQDARAAARVLPVEGPVQR